jgi:hypothetical protein
LRSKETETKGKKMELVTILWLAAQGFVVPVAKALADEEGIPFFNAWLALNVLWSASAGLLWLAMVLLPAWG